MLNPAALLIFIAAFVFLYWDTLHKMIMIWQTDPNYSHGFLIPFISGYLLWQKRDGLKATIIRPSNAGLLLVFTGLCVYLVGHLSGELFSMRFSMIIVLAGAVVFSSGAGFFKEISFPFFYLIFMLPLPYILYDSVAFPLKLVVSRVSVDFLTHIGILVLREGNIIHLTGTTLEVADACSGIRSIISLLALSTALAYLTQNGWIKKTVLVTLAVPVAIFVNSIRVIGTGILAERYGSEVAEGFFHEFAGLLIFSVAIVILIISAIVLNKIHKSI